MKESGVKSALIALLLTYGCSSWKQKDFEKELSKPVAVTEPKVVANASDEKILEQFVVSPVLKNDVVEKKIIPSPVRLETLKQKVPANKKQNVIEQRSLVEQAPLFPKDYPEEIIQLNLQAKKVWGQYRSNHAVNEKLFLDIHYLGMTVGKIMIINKGRKMINGQEVWHFHARFKSAPFYSSIYELDDTVDTYVSTDQFLSAKYSLIQRESKQEIDDLQLYDRKQLKTFWFYHQKKSNGKVKNKKEEKPIPYFSIDPFSVLFLFQGLPLRNGDLYEIPIINKGKILILRSVVEGREKINTKDGEKSAIRIRATTKYSGATLKSGDLYFWFSDDVDRKLLKAQAKIKIGSVTADIVDN